MTLTVKMEKDPEEYWKSHGYINSAFQGIKSIMEIQKSVLESPFPYKSYGNWNPCGFNGQECGEDGSPAVEIRNGYKSYRTSSGLKRPVLFNMNMTIKKGTIYSLLGSSGCGKTTLLSCLVGLKHLDSGEIFISGKKIGSNQCSVPGRGIGFMPQDIALYGDFSIAETITYFGKLNGMSANEVESSKNFLTELLSLPDQNRRVNTLSGGQQRRVSIAVTLVHAPPLIVLDEPTVGVDALLASVIWKHLVGLVEAKKTTILITTHYIEEAARYSNMVGLMRGGRLLTEKSPSELYLEYGTNSLQDVVLRLCHDDEKSADTGRERSKSSGNILTVEIEKEIDEAVNGMKKSQTSYDFCISTDDIKSSFTRITSLSSKNLSVMTRNLILLAFVILMPAAQIVLMGLSMGSDPKPTHVGVVTNESCDLSTLSRSVLLEEGEGDCIFANLSCRFLSTLPPDIIHLSLYPDEASARADALSGKIQGFMKFPENYSDSMFERSTAGMSVDNATIQQSTISVEMDASNTVITKSIQRILFETYSKFAKGLLLDCGFNSELAGFPIKFENPLYGEYDMELQQFVAAGMIVGVALFFPLASSTITYLWDKKQGTMERAIVAGTHTWELLLSYFVTEGSVLLVQTSLCLLIFVTVFKVTIVGSVGLAFSLLVLNGFAGISLGLLLASICKEEIEAILLAMAIMMPNFFLSGAMWPIQAMPPILQSISYLLPGTLGNISFRNIIVKGWGLSQPGVWSGFLSASLWISAYWIINIWVHRFKSAKN